MTAKYNFRINQGADHIVPLVFKNGDGTLLDLDGVSCSMQLRKTKSSEKFEDWLTTQNGRIVIDVEAARAVLHFPNAVTKALPAQSLVYDLELTTANGNVTRVLEGVITVSAEVTRDDDRAS